MQLLILAPGRVRQTFLREGCDHYLERLKHYDRVSLVEVREEPIPKTADTSVVKRREAQRLREKLSPGAVVVALDEHGQHMTSEALATFVREQRDRGVKELVFMLGGPLGLEPELLASAQRKLALSAMTLPHELARLLLLEQLYRAYTILHGEPYHNP